MEKREIWFWLALKSTLGLLLFAIHTIRDLVTCKHNVIFQNRKKMHPASFEGDLEVYS